MNTGFIIECNFKVSFTCKDDVPVVVISIKKNHSLRQIALVSDLGDILSYSDQFTQFAGVPNKDLHGFNIKNLFPELKSLDLNEFQPYLLSSLKIHLVICYKVFDGAIIHFVLLINDMTEIEN